MILVAAAALTMTSCHTKQESKPLTLSGAGATFPQPFYTMVFKAYHEQTGNVVSYGGIGSGGGITFVFTDYLCKVSPQWNEKYGRGKSVSFPTGIAAKGNPGIAGVLSQTDGSIGYVGVHALR